MGASTRASIHTSIVFSKLHGWDYGAQLGFKTSTSSFNAPGKDSMSRTYIYAQNPNVGRVEFGTRKSAANSMKIHAGDVASGAGGVDGGWPSFLGVDTENLDSSNFVAAPDLVISEGIHHYGYQEKYRKLTFYTPVMHGLKIGISYGPDGANAGNRVRLPWVGSPNVATKTLAIKDRAYNILSGGVSLEHKNDKQEFKFSVVGEYAKYNLIYGSEKITDISFNPYKAIMVGGLYKYDKLSFAASYGNHFKSGFAKSDEVSDIYVCTLGTNYAFSKGSVSLGYLFSSKNTNTFELISAGIDYKLAPGLIPYAEIDYFNAHQKKAYTKVDPTKSPAKKSYFTATNSKNHGAIFIIGMKIQF